MKHERYSVVRPLHLLALAAAMLLGSARADEYSDVTQLVRSGKLAEAMTKAEQYLTTKPKDPQMRFLKGVIQRDSGKAPEAIGTFTRLTEDYPELPEPYNNLAVLYAGQSQFDKARTALEMAIRTNPSYATAHENLGDVYAKLASQAYNKALQLDNTNTAVAPKLALIRELFSAANAKTQVAGLRPAPTPAVPTSVPAATPAVVKPTPSLTVQPPSSPVVPDLSGSSTKDAEAAVRAWASAWAAKDIKSYLASYGKEFVPPAAMSRGEWETERKQRIGSKTSINIKLENLLISVDGNNAVAKFRQDYKASGLAVSSRKTLELLKTGDRWHIVKESTGS